MAPLRFCGLAGHVNYHDECMPPRVSCAVLPAVLCGAVFFHDVDLRFVPIRVPARVRKVFINSIHAQPLDGRPRPHPDAHYRQRYH